ncbi:MAG: hypothetical protein WDA07_14300 [Leucobacter sp.]
MAEPVGEVELMSGGFVRVGVTPSGDIEVAVSTADRRYVDRNGIRDIAPVDAGKIAVLMIQAAALAPTIWHHQQVKHQAVMAAEKAYEQAVADAIGGAS